LPLDIRTIDCQGGENPVDRLNPQPEAAIRIISSTPELPTPFDGNARNFSEERYD